MPQKSPVDIAKAPILAYNEKDWEGHRAAVTPGFILDEVGTQRKIRGVNDVIAAFQGWAKAMPDSKATFDAAFTSGNTVVLEVTWRGTHTGPLQTPGGEIAATGKKFEVRACQVVEIANDKTQAMRHYFDMITLLQQLGVAS
jgi:steroid delta-isomerase-like uncharacterized protein